MVIWKHLRNINLAMPEELLSRVDEAAIDRYMSRSEYIRFVLDEAVGRKRSRRVEDTLTVDPTRFLNVDDS